MQRYTMKQHVKAALKEKYGFAPVLHNIKIVQAKADGTYIAVDINDHLYTVEGKLSKYGLIRPKSVTVRRIRTPAKK